MGALTSAAFLAKKGVRVTVLEQYQKPGGYLHCFKRFGRRFDTGAHYTGALEEGQPFHALLTYLGVYDPSLFIPLNPQGFDVLQFPKFTVEIPKGYEHVIEAFARVFPQERTAIENYCRLTRQAARSFPIYEFNSEPIDDQALLSWVQGSLASVVTQLTDNEALRALFYSYCSLHGVIPEDVPFGFHAIVVDSLVRGPYGFARGGDALAAKFVRVIEAHGGEVRLRTQVVKIETHERTAVAVHTANGERIAADRIISGVHPKVTFGLVDRPEIFSPAFRSRLSKIRQSIGIFGMYGLHTEPSDFDPLRNYFYFPSEDSRAMFSYTTPEQTPNVAFLCPSERVRQVKRDKHHTTLPISIHAIGPFEWFAEWKDSIYGKRPDAYTQRKQLYSAKVLDMLETFGIPMSERFTQYVSSSPITNLHFNGSEEGSSYGIYHSFENVGVRALGPRTHVANLFLTGQNTVFPGILGSAISGLKTVGTMIGIRPLLKDLQAVSQGHDPQ